MCSTHRLVLKRTESCHPLVKVLGMKNVNLSSVQKNCPIILFEKTPYLEIGLVVWFWLHCDISHQTSALNKVKTKKGALCQYLTCEYKTPVSTDASPSRLAQLLLLMAAKWCSGTTYKSVFCIYELSIDELTITMRLTLQDDISIYI